MKLAEEDVRLFYKLHPALLFYANQRTKKVKNVSTLEEFLDLSLEEKLKIRNALCDKTDLIASFTEENPFEFSAEDLEVVESWKNLIRGSFFLIRYLKKYAIFLDEGDPPHAYGVVALTDEFAEILGPSLPLSVETVLLPFKGQITYDGLLATYRITFGGGIRRSLNDSYEEAKSRHGIISSLPFSPKETEQPDADRLRSYLKSKRNREMYGEEIEELVSNDSSLLILYHQEMGRIHARGYKRRFKEIGLTHAWFAILEGITIASGITREEVERTAQSIVPAKKREFVYIFQFKGKQQ